VADDTGTDWAAEAEWHERQACPAGLPWTGDDPSSDHGHTDCLHHHTAAVGLRRLAQLDTAIGAQPELADSLRKAQAIIRHKFSPAVANPVQRAAEMMDRLAAVLGSGEQPEGPTTCPTCGSTQPGAPHTGRWWRRDDGELLNQHGPCPDSWHERQHR